MADLDDLYQEVILDHNKSPRNFRAMAGANRKAEGYNPLCGDHVTVFLQVEDGVIKDISFQGSGCAISKASASMMTAELKGKTIGVSTLTGGTTNMIEEVLLKGFKLKPGEYRYLVVGTSPERYAALKSGSVQATFMGPPFNFRAQQDGFTKLITFHEILGPIQFTADFGHMNYLKSNRNEVVRYLKSMIEATNWLYDTKNKEEALAIHMKILKSKRDIAEQDYKYLIEEFQPFPRNGAVNKEAMEKTIDLRAKEGTYKGKKVPSYTEYVDNTFVEEAQKLAAVK